MIIAEMQKGELMAIKTDGTSITIPAGDSAEIAITPHSGEDIYLLGAGEKVIFSIFPVKGSEPIIEKTSEVQTEDGAILFSLTQEDTSIPRGSYCWTAKLVDSSGELIDTFIGGLSPAAFYVK